jgi:SAM-dependent methyltransferase
MIGEDIRNRVFRDTNSFYLTPAGVVASPSLVRFARRHAGQEVLDLGCAIGSYSLRLMELGYTVTGADINPEYVRKARDRGVNAQVVTDLLPFADGSFDTVLLFEVVEHLENPAPVLREARRVARKNVLITVPHSGDVELLQRQGLLYEHFADLDHKNFFTVESLRELLNAHFPAVRVWKGNGLNPFGLVPCTPVRWFGRLLSWMRPAPVRFHFRLFAVATVS